MISELETSVSNLKTNLNMSEPMKVDEKAEEFNNYIYQIAVDLGYMQLTSIEINNFDSSLTLALLIAHINSAVSPINVWSSKGFGGIYYHKAKGEESGKLILLGSVEWCNEFINAFEDGNINSIFFQRWKHNSVKVTSHILTDHGDIYWEKNEANYKDARNIVWISHRFLKADDALKHVHDLVKDDLRYFIVDSKMEDEYRTFLVGFYSDKAGRLLTSTKTEKDLIIERKRDIKFRNLANLFNTSPEFISNASHHSTEVSNKKLEMDTYFLHKKVKEGQINPDQLATICGLNIKSEEELKLALENNSYKPVREEKRRNIPKRGSWYRNDYVDNGRKRGLDFASRRGEYHSTRGLHRRSGFYRNDIYYAPMS
ncbi:hypothetical protein PVAND_017613 [Polypedilum vanderplanki]|uniref:Uncharacterized protein n=1 Tax=Polypedilum vanderplanki TaxID=319348 RepID=A0A9J6B936_POLVA|nr:hypothetical protein PVAND_017613 [Polypedilum vanderplanki]